MKVFLGRITSFSVFTSLLTSNDCRRQDTLIRQLPCARCKQSKRRSSPIPGELDGGAFVAVQRLGGVDPEVVVSPVVEVVWEVEDGTVVESV